MKKNYLQGSISQQPGYLLDKSHKDHKVLGYWPNQIGYLEV